MARSLIVLPDDSVSPILTGLLADLEGRIEGSAKLLAIKKDS
jgi:hypothetical protein